MVFIKGMYNCQHLELNADDKIAEIALQIKDFVGF